MSKIVVNFYANVSEPTTRDLMGFVMQSIAQQNSNDPIDELIIQIASAGGSSDHGLLLYNFLRQLQLPKTTIGMGNVDSAAVMLFAAGDKRLAAPSCRFVLHEARATINGEFNATKLQEITKITKRITEDYINVVAHVTGKTKALISKKVKDGVALSAGEAKTMNLITDVVETPYIQLGQNVSIMMINNPAQPSTPRVSQGAVDNPNNAEVSI